MSQASAPMVTGQRQTIPLVCAGVYQVDIVMCNRIRYRAGMYLLRWTQRGPAHTGAPARDYPGGGADVARLSGAGYALGSNGGSMVRSNEPLSPLTVSTTIT